MLRIAYAHKDRFVRHDLPAGSMIREGMFMLDLDYLSKWTKTTIHKEKQTISFGSPFLRGTQRRPNNLM